MNFLPNKPFKEEDELIIKCKDILSKKTAFKYVYEENRMDIDKEGPTKFSLKDVL